MKRVASLLVLSILLGAVFAQAPSKMSYQAVIRNASNNLVINQAVGMRVSILQGSASGTEVYKEIFSPNPQTNANGLVSIEIGGGVPVTGTFANINWANGPYFVKTETDPTGGTSYTITGTSQLLSVPYALYAAKSASPWKDSTIIDFSVPKPIIYSNKFTMVSRDNFNSAVEIRDGVIEMTGKPTFIDFKNNNQKDANMRFAYDNSGPVGRISISTLDTLPVPTWQWEQFVFTEAGRMGIGTNNPRVKLDVRGDVRSFNSDTTNYVYLGGADGALRIKRSNDFAHIDFSASTDTAVRIGLVNNGFAINTGQTLTSYNERFRILSNGNTGIGNSNPKSKLTVSGGDVNITDIASGVILKSPNGNCWRVTIDNSGNLVRTAITCP